MYQKCADKIPQSCFHKWYIFVIISSGRKENNDKYNFTINKKERRLIIVKFFLYEGRIKVEYF